MTTIECAHRYEEDLDRDLLKCVLDANKELLQELLDAGANALRIDGEKGSPLSCAIASGDEEMVRMLLTTVSVTAQPCTSKGMSLLHIAAKMGRCQIGEILCENKSDINSYYKGCLELGQIACAFFYKLGTEDQVRPLHFACNANHLDVVEALIKHGAKIDCEDLGSRSPLPQASETGFLRISEIRQRHGASVNSRCHDMLTPLHFAVRRGYVDVGRLLLQHGAEVKARDRMDRTALHMAIKSNRTDVVELLLKHGADMNNEAFDDMSTPLHFAVRRGYVDVARFLLEHGAEVNARDRMDRTALHIAIKSNRTDVVELLVKHGADMNNVAFDGQPALHWACDLGYKEVVEVLLGNGADVNIKAKFYGTPLEWVLAKGNYRCLELLERHIIKLKAASLYVLDSNLYAISAATNLAAFQEECESEIQRMTQTKINNSITFYDILAQDTNHVSVYMKNRVLHQAMMSGEYKTMFSIYAKMIETSIVKGHRRLELLKASLESLNTLIGHRLPHMFVMDVLMHLNQEDHKNLIASTKEG